MWRSVLLILGLCGVLAGCSWTGSGAGGGASGQAARDRLQIVVRLLPHVRAGGSPSSRCRAASPTVRRYGLTCGPVGGTAPNPAAACRAVADYLHRRSELPGCPGVLVGPGSTATIAGMVSDRPFRLRIVAGYSWCGQSKPLLRDFWILSVFPCSNPVLRSGRGDFASWARSNGCEIDGVAS
jgi:hypothetical protein